MHIDAHQHFWQYDAAEYPWMKQDWPIRRDFLPPDLAPLLAAAGLDGTVAVQARQTLDESYWLLELADAHPLIKGVVGWVDLRAADVTAQLAEFAKYPKFVGVRHVVQDEKDDRFMMRPDFLRGIEQLRDFDLTYDILIFPKQLPAAIELVKKFPKQPFVLDHIAKPFIKGGVLKPWQDDIRQLARASNVSCKLSGMITEAKWAGWSPAEFTPYLDVVFKAFGQDRLMFGSDWPVCLLAGRYAQVHKLVLDYVERLPDRTHQKVFGDNAVNFYGLSQ